MAKAEMRRCQGPCGRNRNAEKNFAPAGKICKTCQRKTAARAARARRLLEVYELLMEEYDEIKEEQNGVCAGCGGDRTYDLHVDHDHAVEKTDGVRASLRGLLCKRCNKVLRDIHDNIQILKNLIAYLEDPPAQRVLGRIRRRLGL